MADYIAPLEDMNFVLNHLVDLDALAQLPGYEDLSTELADSILQEAGKLASNVLSPLNAPGDKAGVHIHGDAEVATPSGFSEAYSQFVDSGWGSLQFDTDFGGQGLPFALAIPVQEMWHAANMAWGLCPLLSQGAIEAIEVNASQELKARYLPNMIDGRWSGTMNLTEPHAGSDMATLRTRAERQGDHYRIFGQKIYITWGEHDMADNVVHLVLARLPDGPPGVKGLSLFLVPKFLANDDGSIGQRNDLRVLSVEHKIGVHASPTCVMSYGENEGAIGYLVGQEHRGMACMFSMMNNARLTVGLQGVSIAERAYQLARDHAKDRPQGIAPGESSIGPIIKHPDVRRMLMTMRALTEASRAVAYVACSSVDLRNKHPDPEQRAHHDARAALLTPVVKGWCTEIGPEVASIGVQVHGGMGYVEETGAGQYYRDSRILPIYEGTNGIQSIDLAERKTRFDNGRAVDSLIVDMRAVIEQGLQGDEKVCRMAQQFAASVDALDEVKNLLLTRPDDDIYFSGSASFNYLLMMGVVCGGWQMLRATIAANGEQGRLPFFANKIKVAQFYMDSVLPRYLSYAAAINAGSESTMALAEGDF
ncbi:MAG: acyl-CoA dehydrogenase [Arenicella sp.]|nr:acyl-CoA dehydrogenase [Arenicella sp.]